MLKEAYANGVQAALETFGVKAAFNMGAAGAVAKDWGGRAVRALIGHPDKIMREGMGTFGSKGHLSLENTFWPKVPAQGTFWDKALPWAGRAFNTGLPALGVVNAVRGKGDPNESKLTNALEAVGSGLGGGYGMQGLGILGGGVVARTGGSLGKNLGRAFSSRPQAPQFQASQYQQPAMPTEQMYQGQLGLPGQGY